MQNLMELKNAASLGFYASRRNCQESPKWFGMLLATRHKTKTETWIEEPLTPMDSWDRILAREPLTPRCHASEVAYSLISISFSQFEANQHLD
jgi:hypothetical protein